VRRRVSALLAVAKPWVFCNISSMKAGPYGQTPDYIDMMGMAHLSSMTRCIANPVATVTSGQDVRIHSIYDSPTVQDDVMGIMIAYIA
jgi:hypothetical protein